MFNLFRLTMPQNSKNRHFINKELHKWLLLSQKMKTSGHIYNAKIKANLATLESHSSKEELDILSSELGNK